MILMVLCVDSVCLVFFLIIFKNNTVQFYIQLMFSAKL